MLPASLALTPPLLLCVALWQRLVLCTTPPPSPHHADVSVSAAPPVTFKLPDRWFVRVGRALAVGVGVGAAFLLVVIAWRGFASRRRRREYMDVEGAWQGVLCTVLLTIVTGLVAAFFCPVTHRDTYSTTPPPAL